MHAQSAHVKCASTKELIGAANAKKHCVPAACARLEKWSYVGVKVTTFLMAPNFDVSGIDVSHAENDPHHQQLYLGNVPVVPKLPQPLVQNQ